MPPRARRCSSALLSSRSVIAPPPRLIAPSSSISPLLGGIAFAVHPVFARMGHLGNKKTMLNAVRVGGVLSVELSLLTRFGI